MRAAGIHALTELHHTAGRTGGQEHLPCRAAAAQILNSSRGSFAFGKATESAGFCQNADKPRKCKNCPDMRNRGQFLLSASASPAACGHLRPCKTLACKFASMSCRLSHRSVRLFTLSTDGQKPQDSAPPVILSNFCSHRDTSKNCKKTIFAQGNGISRRKNWPYPTYASGGTMKARKGLALSRSFEGF